MTEFAENTLQDIAEEQASRAARAAGRDITSADHIPSDPLRPTFPTVKEMREFLRLRESAAFSISWEMAGNGETLSHVMVWDGHANSGIIRRAADGVLSFYVLSPR